MQTLAIYQNKAVIIVCQYLSAAFDTIDHTILINRLEKQVGITEKCSAWYCSYKQETVCCNSRYVINNERIVEFLLHSDMPRQLESLLAWIKLALLLIGQTSTPAPSHENCFPMIVEPLEVHNTRGMPS